MLLVGCVSRNDRCCWLVVLVGMTDVVVGCVTGWVRLIRTRLIRSYHLIRSLFSQLFTLIVYFNCFNCLFYVVIRIST